MAFVKPHYLLVFAQDLQVDLHTAKFGESGLGVAEQLRGDPFTAVFRQNGEGVYPPPVAVVTGHNSANNAVARQCHEEQSVVYS